jgi:phosphoribosylglycinamide formyltransferase 1
VILSKGDESIDTVRIAVLASGRGSNFEALCRGDTGAGRIALLLVDNPNARALQLAGELGVDSEYIPPGDYRTRFGIEEERHWVRAMMERDIGLVCLAGLMRILKGPVLKEYSGRILNIHPSLLPSFPGLNAQRQALEYGVKVTGCTVHYVDEGIDTGPIILQRAVEVSGDDDEESLSGKILEQEHAAYSQAVRLHCSGRISITGRRACVINDD